MCELIFKKSISRDGYYLAEMCNELPKKLSMTKALGGKDLFIMSKWWSHKGVGGWITDYFIKLDNVEKVKQSLQSFDIDSKWLD